MSTVKKPEPLLHSSKLLVGGGQFDWPIHEQDVTRIREQVRKNPARTWPSQLAAEWDISEGLARRFIRGKA